MMRSASSSHSLCDSVWISGFGGWKVEEVMLYKGGGRQEGGHEKGDPQRGELSGEWSRCSSMTTRPDRPVGSHDDEATCNIAIEGPRLAHRRRGRVTKSKLQIIGFTHPGSSSSPSPG